MKALSLAIAALCICASHAQAAQIENYGDLFRNEEKLTLSMSYDISQLRDTKGALTEKGLPGKLTLGDKTINVEVMARGGGSMTCLQPQLKIGFNKAETANTPFAGFKALKLFTSGRCVSNLPEENKLILSNYLIYKLQEQIFPFAYKTRLVEIDYTDLSGKLVPLKQLAFFIEPDSYLGKRLNLKRVSQDELNAVKEKLQTITDPQTVELMYAFQFFIGNMDFGIPGFYSPILQATFTNEKNVHVYRNGEGVYIPLAFDFDLSRFSYVENFCNFGASFNAFSGDITTCKEKSLISMTQGDLKAYKEPGMVVANFPKIKEGFLKWRTKYDAQIKSLSPRYAQDADNFLAVFEKALNSSGN